ncbi:hypothetical protein ACCS86_37465, partial [Rhizobium ruizarguesonis]
FAAVVSSGGIIVVVEIVHKNKLSESVNECQHPEKVVSSLPKSCNHIVGIRFSFHDQLRQASRCRRSQSIDSRPNGNISADPACLKN